MTAIASTARPRSSIADVWAHREMLRAMVVRGLKVKYQRSALGFVWTLLNPLLMMGLLVAIFTHVVRIPIRNYWAFTLSGYFAWNFLSQGIGVAAYVFSEHAGLRRSIAFPSEVLVIAVVIARLVEFVAELVPVVAILALFHHDALPASFAIVPLLVLLEFVLVLGLVMPISTLAVFYRDVEHALPVALTILFYASPVFYPLAMVPERFRALYLLNPVADLISAYQSALYDGRFPPPAILGRAALVSIIIFAVGYGIFRRHKRVFAEIV